MYINISARQFRALLITKSLVFISINKVLIGDMVIIHFEVVVLYGKIVKVRIILINFTLSFYVRQPITRYWTQLLMRGHAIIGPIEFFVYLNINPNIRNSTITLRAFIIPP